MENRNKRIGNISIEYYYSGSVSTVHVYFLHITIHSATKHFDRFSFCLFQKGCQSVI